MKSFPSLTSSNLAVTYRDNFAPTICAPAGIVRVSNARKPRARPIDPAPIQPVATKFDLIALAASTSPDRADQAAFQVLSVQPEFMTPQKDSRPSEDRAGIRTVTVGANEMGPPAAETVTGDAVELTRK